MPRRCPEIVFILTLFDTLIFLLTLLRLLSSIAKLKCCLITQSLCHQCHWEHFSLMGKQSVYIFLYGLAFSTFSCIVFCGLSISLLVHIPILEYKHMSIENKYICTILFPNNLLFSAYLKSCRIMQTNKQKRINF